VDIDSIGRAGLRIVILRFFRAFALGPGVVILALQKLVNLRGVGAVHHINLMYWINRAAPPFHAADGRRIFETALQAGRRETAVIAQLLEYARALAAARDIGNP
jgi:hypothetical protein